MKVRSVVVVAVAAISAFGGSIFATEVLSSAPAQARGSIAIWACRNGGNSVYANVQLCGYGLADKMQPRWKCQQGSVYAGSPVCRPYYAR